MASSQVPGFIACFFDIPFPTSIPNGTYIVLDPVKGIAAVTLTLREGTCAFFRNVPLQGPTSFEQLRKAQQEPPRPRQNHSYLAVNKLHDGGQKSTLSVNSGVDGGYAECKYFSEVCVTFLSDDVDSLSQGDVVFSRVCDILNPFLDKYRILSEDYRISRISLERNFYFATCHTSPLENNERALSTKALFDTLEVGRVFRIVLGHGAGNILRTNSYELLGPRSPLDPSIQPFFHKFLKEDYSLPLSYVLILDAISCLQRTRDYRLAIVHAETAVEVHNRALLRRLMVHYGMAETQADTLIDDDRNYWGVKNKLRRLDEWNMRYCGEIGHAFTAFVGSSLYSRWELELYGRRNAAVHEGVSGFTYDEASAAIGIAKECIVMLETRVPGMQNRIQLNVLMSGYRLNSGEVVF
jgi:hypothetical protein